MIKLKFLYLAVITALAVSGCAGKTHIIGYDIMKGPLPPPNLGKIWILPFSDERPQEECKGVKGKLLTFSSKDSHFSKNVPQALQEILAQELNNAGFFIVKEQTSSDFNISGALKHFQAIISPAKITFLPYLGSVSTLWAKDDFTIALSIYIKMTDQSGETKIDKTFDVSQDMKLPTGLLSLARYSRGFNYKLKLLDEALKDVMRQIREEALNQVKK